jgi:hypothetical protein
MTDPVTNVTTSSILSSVNTLEACNQVEIDKVVTNWLPVCVGGVQWFVAEQILFNNVTQTEVLTKIYKQGANGAVVTTAPSGTIVDGSCEVPETPKNLLGGVLKVTDNPLGDGTTEYPSGFVLQDLPEIQNGTHKLRSFSYKIYWNNIGEFLEVNFADTNSIYHYDDIFYHATSRFFGEDTINDNQILPKIVFSTKGRSFFEINYLLEEI